MERLAKWQASRADSVRARLQQVAAALLVVILCAAAPHSLAAAADKCSTKGVLDKGTGADLLIDVPCTVNAGTYHYHDVNIIKGGSLQFSDAVINFWAHGILIEDQGSLIAGVVGAAADGSGGTIVPIGTAGGKLIFHLYGKDEGIHGAGITCKSDRVNQCGVPGTADSGIWGGNAKSTPASCTSTPNLPGGVDDCFYKYDTLPYDDGGGLVPGYFGYKVLGVSYGGTLRLYGLKGAEYPDTTVNPQDSGMSWARLNTCAGGVSTGSCVSGVLQAKATMLVLDGPANKQTLFPFNGVNWQKNDQVVISTTDYLPSHSEVATIDSVSTDGKTITLAAPGLVYPHNASAYPVGEKIAASGHTGLSDLNVVDTRAAVGLLSRSIAVVGEENKYPDLFPAPVVPPDPKNPSYFFGGHVVIRQGFKEVQIQGVQFYHLGQGGKMGHYPIHFHMARKVPTPATAPTGPTFVKDSSIVDSMTRWIVVHATQGVLLARNVGYRSIGHGYYLEDGTETNNQLYSNLGVSAIAAVNDAANIRQVPGILAFYKTQHYDNPKEDIGISQVPYQTDIDDPTIFWSLNGWNDWEYNMAAGAETCGFCYWMVAANVSGGSKMMNWTGYASEQVPFGNDGFTPIKEFLGNSCSTAMGGFTDIAAATTCLGTTVGDVTLAPIDNPLIPVPQVAVKKPVDRDLSKEMFYPTVHGANRKATLCPSDTADCTGVKECANGNEGPCAVTVLDRFTTSFNWTEHNFGAIWLRALWHLVLNSAVTDVINGGLSFVTGGGYTRSDFPPGMWDLARKSVFIGNTQAPAASPYALTGGPVNPSSFAAIGLSCKNKNINYCLAADSDGVDQGVLFPLTNFATNERLFNIYDGPAYEDSNAFLDVQPTKLDDCDLTSSAPQKRCTKSKWMEGVIAGLPGFFVADTTPVTPPSGCYLPNAAIAWKQPNGFYYPPAFHSTNLYFNNVAIRHYVIEPQFKPGTYQTNLAAAQARYCNIEDTSFNNFTDIDRQTELNDDDGSLTGLENTVSVNEDPFFSSPTEDTECKSDVTQNPAGTAKTSPYDYVTAVVFPQDCTVARPPGPDPACNGNTNWYYNCGNGACYGVPLYRQYLNPSDTTPPLPIKMSSQGTGQRETMVPNNGLYYIDTTVPKTTQSAFGGDVSVFESNKTYHVFLLFAKPGSTSASPPIPPTIETFKLYVGPDFNTSTLQAETANLNAGAPVFKLLGDTGALPSSWTTCYSNGVLTVQMNMNFAAFATDYNGSAASYCQPSSMCSWSGSACQCSITDKTNYLYNDCQANNSAICAWSVKDIDYPSTNGAYGFRFTLPAGFTASLPPMPDPRPALAGCFPQTPGPPPTAWSLLFTPASSAVAGSCFYNSTPPPPAFCTAPAPPVICPVPSEDDARLLTPSIANSVLSWRDVR